MNFAAIFIVILILTVGDVLFVAVRSSLFRRRHGGLTVYLCLAAHELILVVQLVLALVVLSRTYWVSAGLITRMLSCIRAVAPLFVVKAFLTAFPCVYRDAVLDGRRWAGLAYARRAWSDGGGYGALVALDLLFSTAYALSMLHLMFVLTEKTMYSPYHLGNSNGADNGNPAAAAAAVTGGALGDSDSNGSGGRGSARQHDAFNLTSTRAYSNNNGSYNHAMHSIGSGLGGGSSVTWGGVSDGGGGVLAGGFPLCLDHSMSLFGHSGSSPAAGGGTAGGILRGGKTGPSSPGGTAVGFQLPPVAVAVTAGGGSSNGGRYSSPSSLLSAAAPANTNGAGSRTYSNDSKRRSNASNSTTTTSITRGMSPHSSPHSALLHQQLQRREADSPLPFKLLRSPLEGHHHHLQRNQRPLSPSPFSSSLRRGGGGGGNKRLRQSPNGNGNGRQLSAIGPITPLEIRHPFRPSTAQGRRERGGGNSGSGVDVKVDADDDDGGDGTGGYSPYLSSFAAAIMHATASTPGSLNNTNNMAGREMAETGATPTRGETSSSLSPQQQQQQQQRRVMRPRLSSARASELDSSSCSSSSSSGASCATAFPDEEVLAYRHARPDTQQQQLRQAAGTLVGTVVAAGPPTALYSIGVDLGDGDGPTTTAEGVIPSTGTDASNTGRHIPRANVVVSGANPVRVGKSSGSSTDNPANPLRQASNNANSEYSVGSMRRPSLLSHTAMALGFASSKSNNNIRNSPATPAAAMGLGTPSSNSNSGGGGGGGGGFVVDRRSGQVVPREHMEEMERQRRAARQQQRTHSPQQQQTSSPPTSPGGRGGERVSPPPSPSKQKKYNPLGLR